MLFKSKQAGFLALTLVAIVAVAIVGLSNIAGAVPGAGKSGNPPGVEPATTLQDLIDCCQTKATVAEYQDNAPTNQVMGTCTRKGIETFRTGGLPALQSYIGGICGETCITRTACSERGEGWSVQPISKELCESGFACGIAAEYTCMCPI